MEKEEYSVNDSPAYNGHGQSAYVDPTSGIESKEGRLQEATDMYGNVEDAEHYGYVTRGYV